MLEKIEILFVILVLLIIYYIVISLGAGNTDKSLRPEKIKNYLFGVRILIIIIGIVSGILWFFL